MTHAAMDEFNAGLKQFHPTTEQGYEALQKFINGDHSLHVPPQIDDADMVIGRIIDERAELQETVRAKETELKELRLKVHQMNAAGSHLAIETADKDQEVERLQAECAYYRAMLEMCADMKDYGAAYYARESLKKTTAGAQLLERYKRMKRVCKTAKSYIQAVYDELSDETDQAAKRIALSSALDELEETP